MNNFKQPAVLLVSILCLAIGIGVLPEFIRTAGALGAWDVGLAGIFAAFFLTAVFWIRSVWLCRPTSFTRWGWASCLVFSMAVIGFFAQRNTLAEYGLKRFDLLPQKRPYSGLHSRILEKVGIHIVFREVWSTDNHWPVDGIPTQEALEEAMAMLAICNPKHLTLTCSEGVRSMEPLRKLKSLSRLIVHLKSPADCSALADLPELTSLNVGGANTEIDLRALARAPKLAYLAIAGVSGTDAGTFLPASPSLKTLSIDLAPQLVRFDSRSVLPNLTDLRLLHGSPQLDFTNLPEFAPSLNFLILGPCDEKANLESLGRLSQLRTMTLRNSGHSFPRLPRLNALAHARFYECNIPSLSALADALPNAVWIYIGEQSTTLRLEGLDRLTKLSNLEICGCPVDAKPEHLEIGKRLKSFQIPKPNPTPSSSLLKNGRVFHRRAKRMQLATRP